MQNEDVISTIRYMIPANRAVGLAGNWHMQVIASEVTGLVFISCEPVVKAKKPKDEA